MISDQIQVLDDFLPVGTYGCLERFIGAEPMTYGSRSNSRTDTHGHWSRKFIAAGKHNLADVAGMLEQNREFAPLDEVWKLLKAAALADSVLIRCYLNGYTYGTDGYFHRDSSRVDEQTVILYMNEHWEPDWAGETAFLGDDLDIIRSVLPKPNRAVIFPSNMLHAGRAVSRKCTFLRKTLLFKTRKRRSDDFERLSHFLRQAGATNFRHRSGSLHDHLVRTFAILEARGVARSVCLGGGLHAIYGTSAFAHSVLTPASKSALIEEFGDYAEHLASIFSRLDRPKALQAPLEMNQDAASVYLTDGQTVQLERPLFDDLKLIECANLLDQNALMRYPELQRFWAHQ